MSDDCDETRDGANINSALMISEQFFRHSVKTCPFFLTIAQYKI